MWLIWEMIDLMFRYWNKWGLRLYLMMHMFLLNR